MDFSELLNNIDNKVYWKAVFESGTTYKVLEHEKILYNGPIQLTLKSLKKLQKDLINKEKIYSVCFGTYAFRDEDIHPMILNHFKNSQNLENINIQDLTNALKDFYDDKYDDEQQDFLYQLIDQTKNVDIASSPSFTYSENAITFCQLNDYILMYQSECQSITDLHSYLNAIYQVLIKDCLDILELDKLAVVKNKGEFPTHDYFCQSKSLAVFNGEVLEQSIKEGLKLIKADSNLAQKICFNNSLEKFSFAQDLKLKVLATKLEYQLPQKNITRDKVKI